MGANSKVIIPKGSKSSFIEAGNSIHISILYGGGPYFSGMNTCRASRNVFIVSNAVVSVSITTPFYFISRILSI